MGNVQFTQQTLARPSILIMLFTYVHEGEQFLCHPSNKKLSKQNEIGDGFVVHVGGVFDQLRKLFDQLAVQRLVHRFVLVNFFLELREQKIRF